MTLDEYQTRINNVINDIQGGAHARIMVELAQDAIALIKARVVGRGVNPEGEKYRDYTPKYRKYKTKKGKYRGFVDFSFSTRMWASIKLVSSESQLKLGIAKVTATTTFEQDKLNWNTGSRGVILGLADFERDILLEEYDKKILDIWRRNGL